MTHSMWALMPSLLLWVACAAAPPPPKTVLHAQQLRELDKILLQGAAGSDFKNVMPIRVDFITGDQVPLDLFLAGDVIQTAPNAPPLQAEVKQPFSMIIYGDRAPEFSFDGGRTFRGLDAFHGDLAVAVAASKQAGGRLKLGMVLRRCQ